MKASVQFSRCMARAIAWLVVPWVLLACASVKTTGSVPVADGTIAYTHGGTGTPTVVLQAGFGNGKNAWAPIIAEAQRSNTVFAYDRPGYGDSSANTGPRDACTIATELRTVLHDAGFKPPYILVGHSLGGLYQYVYARMYPQDVAGLLLLDPTPPDHWAQMQSNTPGVATMLKSMRLLAFDSTMRREFDGQTDCLDALDAKTPLQMPTKILVSSIFSELESGAFEQMVRKSRPAWLPRTGAAEVEEVAGAGHFIHKDQPARVIQAIKALSDLSQVRTP